MSQNKEFIFGVLLVLLLAVLIGAAFITSFPDRESCVRLRGSAEHPGRIWEKVKIINRGISSVIFEDEHGRRITLYGNFEIYEVEKGRFGIPKKD